MKLTLAVNNCCWDLQSTFGSVFGLISKITTPGTNKPYGITPLWEGYMRCTFGCARHCQAPIQHLATYCIYGGETCATCCVQICCVEIVTIKTTEVGRKLQESILHKVDYFLTFLLSCAFLSSFFCVNLTPCFWSAIPHEVLLKCLLFACQNEKFFRMMDEFEFDDKFCCVLSQTLHIFPNRSFLPTNY